MAWVIPLVAPGMVLRAWLGTESSPGVVRCAPWVVLQPHWLGTRGARLSNCAPCCGCRTYAGTPGVLPPTCKVCFDS